MEKKNNFDSIFNKLYDFESKINCSIKKTDICEFCKNENFVIDTGFQVCTNCGFQKRIYIDDKNPEWNFYIDNTNRKSNPIRCGLPTNELLPKSSMGTKMTKYTRSNNYRSIKQYQLWQAMPYKERNLNKIFNTIRLVCHNNNLNKCIVREAVNLYKKISERKLSRGSNRKGLIAASVYFACKIKDVPRSSKEIAKIFNLRTPVITKAIKMFQELDKSKSYLSSKPLDFINRYCSKLNLDSNIMKICKEHLELLRNNHIIYENTPPSIAASVIFYICKKFTNKDMTKHKISKICDVSAVTISKCYNKMLLYYK